MNSMTPMTPMAPSSTTTPPPVQSRRTGLLAAGVTVLACGIVAAAVLWFAAGSRNDDAIRGLARAPIGCDTTLNFAEPGTYLIFAEVEGSLDDIDGTCAESGRFSTTDDDPDLRVSFVDGEGNDIGIDLPRRTDVSYAGAGAEGRSIRSFEIESAGDYTLRVQSPDEGAAVAVGRDPSDGVSLLKNLAALSAIAGLIGGGVLLLLGARRHTMTAAPATPQWSGTTPATSPPGMGVPASPGRPGWEPAVGPPTTLRPPGQPTGTGPTWAAPTPASSPPPPALWTRPETAPEPPRPSLSAAPPPAPSADEPSMWAPNTPQRADSADPTEIDDSSWAPPSE